MKNSRGSRSSLVTSATERASNPASESTRSHVSRPYRPSVWVSCATCTDPSGERSRKAYSVVVVESLGSGSLDHER